MNANELADDAEDLAKQLEKFWIAELITKCATMLRQQQAEIEALKQRIERMIEQASHHEAMAHAGGFEAGLESVTKANEPVAIRYDFDGYGYQYIDSGSGSDWQTRVEGEFLYTHPAKTLTDEEIDDFTVRIYDCRTGAEAHAIVLAILKKVSEK